MDRVKLEADFLQAAKDGDSDKVKALLQAGSVSVDCRQRLDAAQSALHSAGLAEKVSASLTAIDRALADFGYVKHVVC